MSSRRIIIGSCLVLGASACQPSGPTSAPDGHGPAPEPIATADEPAGDDPGTAGDTDPVSDDAVAEPAEPVAQRDAGETPLDPPPQNDSSEPTAALDLPEPIYKKIDKKCGKDAGVGQALKAFDLPTVDGGKVTHTTYRGRVLVVNFWGTWCKPCLKELPEFDQLYRRYRDHGMTLLAIATDEDATPVSDFKKKRRLAAKLALGGEDYANQYGSPNFPFTFVVDTKGVIRASYRGYKPECSGKLEDDIRNELRKRAAPR